VIPFSPAQASYAATETRYPRDARHLLCNGGVYPRHRDPVSTGADELRRYGTPLSMSCSEPFFVAAGFIPVVVILFPPAQTSYAATETRIHALLDTFLCSGRVYPRHRDPVLTDADELRRYGNPVIHATLGAFLRSGGVHPRHRDPVSTGADELRRYGNPVIHELLDTFFCSGGVYPRHRDPILTQKGKNHRL